MENPIQVNDELKKRLDAMGIETVDISIYPSHLQTEKFVSSMFVGRHKKGACIFTVKTSFNNNEQGMLFTVYGQLNKEKMPAEERNGLLKGVFRYDGKGQTRTVTFNVSRQSQEKNCELVMENAIRYFRNFLETYEEFLEDKFTEHIFLWFICEHSDEFQKNPNDKTIDGINKRVKDKFPPGYLVEN